MLDLGCGTGQSALPPARGARAVVGMDPEPDMLRLAAREGARRGLSNVTWVLGADRDVPALGALLPAPRPARGDRHRHGAALDAARRAVPRTTVGRRAVGRCAAVAA
ncbi:class I SAM-dependent methyltransferase [Streptomyces sp. MS19]|uniref:class I SAM-dependent methyltransferase n=1 Tax=Streptomyces sp. MS19 TaxID=3385972 RepID=UPI0039A11F76